MSVCECVCVSKGVDAPQAALVRSRLTRFECNGVAVVRGGHKTVSDLNTYQNSVCSVCV